MGLLGAQAFVNEHSWTKDIGLVLNFEARGSGGPSYMLMETNGKNSKLLSEFLTAKPNYPAANSLMYSIYKKLPNDTDLTVFRENGNINGFNFAFIGDHFDYHTAQDTYERLDRETLLQQADYLTTSLNYFANSDLNNLNSNEDFVYVNFPFSRLLTYPFSWVFPMLIIAIALFIILLFFGLSLGRISIKNSLKGFIPFLISLILCGGFSLGLWKLLLIIHPQYQDILHGFTYNGYTYILAFVFLNLWILLKSYKHFSKEEKVAQYTLMAAFLTMAGAPEQTEKVLEKMDPYSTKNHPLEVTQLQTLNFLQRDQNILTTEGSTYQACLKKDGLHCWLLYYLSYFEEPGKVFKRKDEIHDAAKNILAAYTDDKGIVPLTEEILIGQRDIEELDNELIKLTLDLE